MTHLPRQHGELPWWLVLIIIVTALFFALHGEEARAYTITGPNNDGRHNIVTNIISYYPAIEQALPASLEVRIANWSFNNSAKTSVQADGHIRVDISGTAMMPLFGRLMSHELGHVLEVSHGFLGAWNQVETAHGFGPSLWRYYPQTDWWWWNPSEGWAENFRRGLFWPYYSDLSTPRSYLAWLSRAEVWAFLHNQGI